MSNYVELAIEEIEIDSANPRIAYYLSHYENTNDDTIALLLGTSTSSCESLRESIRQNGGIIHPIIVNKNANGTYKVVEGNTRLQIYRDFLKNNVSGNWTKIKAIVYESPDENFVHSIRLQAHLIGPREWDSYSKAKYLNYLANIERMPMNALISFCGGSSKASEIKNMIAAYNDMESFYRPLCDDDTMFDPKRFQYFVEMQRKFVLDSIISNGFTKTDFSKWVLNENIALSLDKTRIAS